VADSLAIRPSGERRTWTVIDERFQTVAPVEQWLEAHRYLWSPNTVRGYATSLAQWWTFLEQRGEAGQWSELGVPAVSGFLSWLRNGRTVAHALVTADDGPSPETLEARLAAVISFYRWHEAVFGVPVAARLMRATPRRAPARGLLAHLDARAAPGGSSLVRVRRNRNRNRDRPPLLLPQQIQAILDGCAVFDTATGTWVGNLGDRLLFALLAESGMRIGEVLGLRVSDFVMGRGGTPYVEIVPRADNPNDARVKMMRPRRVYVGSDLERLLADYLTHLAGRAAALGLSLTASSPLLVNLQRPPLLSALGEGTVRDKVTALRNKGVGPPGWAPHWFRHSHATALLLAGTAEWVVSRRLGHAHVQTTLDLYGWVREDEALRAAANWKSYAAGWQVSDESCPAACSSSLGRGRGPDLGTLGQPAERVAWPGHRRECHEMEGDHRERRAAPGPERAARADLRRAGLDGALAVRRWHTLLGARTQSAGQHPAPGDAGEPSFPIDDSCDGLGDGLSVAGLVLRHQMGSAAPTRKPRTTAGRVPVRPSGVACPL
jgi:integrase